MIKTVILGPHISVQGFVVRALEDGRVAVRVGKQIFEGIPVR